MKLFELNFNGTITKDDKYTIYDEINSEYAHRLKNQYKVTVGYIENYSVEQISLSDTHCYFLLFDDKTLIGGVEIVNLKNIYKILNTGINKLYWGNNLAVKLYYFLITHFHITLQAGSEQSEGGFKIWQKLLKYPNISIFLKDKITGAISSVTDLQLNTIVNAGYNSYILLAKEKNSI